MAVDATISAYIMPKTPYAELTMESGANITVNGELNVGSRIYSGAGGSHYSGAPTGNSARINMKAGSSITVNGTLYAYGFITGSGTVSAESGSKIHEAFQLCEHRGGSNLMNMLGGTFPMTQYYVQNIEVPLTYKYGCTELLYTNMYILESQNAANHIPFVGSSSGLFRLSNGTTVTRSYNPATDRITMDINGDVAFASTSLMIMDQTINTASYTFPLTHNYTINIHSGTTTVHEKVEFLPGVQVTIDQGATMIFNQRVHIFDRDGWVGKGFTYGGADLISVPYSPAKTYNRTSADLVDARIDVNGTLRAKEDIFTNGGGAHVYTSQGTGIVHLEQKVNSAGAPNAIQYTGGALKEKVLSTPLQLHNTDAAGTTVTAKDGRE